MSTDLAEILTCTGCDAPVTEAELEAQDMHEVNGETFCTMCWADWRAEMAACSHEMVDGTCTKCGLVKEAADA